MPPYRKHRKKIWSPSTITLCSLIVGCVFVLLHWYTEGRATGGVRRILYPVLGLIYTPADSTSGALTSFSSKRALAEENIRLKKRIEALERLATQDRLDALAQDAEDHLAETLSRFPASVLSGRNVRVADIVSYTSYPFGTLGVRFRDRLTDTTPGQLRYVFSEDGTVIGTLDSVNSSVGVVRLFSSFGVEQNMRIGESEMSLVKGKGGITLETEVPKSANIHNDDPVSLPEAGNILVGVVGEIVSKDTDTTQRVLVRLASVPNQIRSVFIIE